MQTGCAPCGRKSTSMPSRGNSMSSGWLRWAIPRAEQSPRCRPPSGSVGFPLRPALLCNRVRSTPGWRRIRRRPSTASLSIWSATLPEIEGQPARHLALLGHAAHLRHHLLHLPELLQELLHLLDRGAAPFGDARRPPSPNNIGIAALVGGHGVDDGFEPLVVVVRDLGLGLPHLGTQSGDHLQELAERPHLLNLLQLLQEILQV